MGKSFKVLINFSLNEFISLMKIFFCGLVCESVLNNKWKLISVSSHFYWGTAKYWDSTRTHFLCLQIWLGQQCRAAYFHNGPHCFENVLGSAHLLLSSKECTNFVARLINCKLSLFFNFICRLMKIKHLWHICKIGIHGTLGQGSKYLFLA